MSDPSLRTIGQVNGDMLNRHNCGVVSATDAAVQVSPGLASHFEQTKISQPHEAAAGLSGRNMLARLRGSWVVHHKCRNIGAWKGALNRDVAPVETTTARDVLYGKRLVRELTAGRVNNPRHRTVVSAQCHWGPLSSLGRDVGTWRVVRLASALFGHSRDQQLIVARPGI